MRGRRTILFRLSGLVLTAILIMAFVSVAVTFYSPPPFRAPVRTSDVLAALRNPEAPRSRGLRDVQFSIMPILPQTATGEYCDVPGTTVLARQVGISPDDLRICVSASDHEPQASRGIPAELRDEFLLAIRTATGWRVAHLPPAPLITRWHLTTLAWLMLAGAVLSGSCLLIVRSITRPLLELAAAARHAGIDGPAFHADPAAPAEVQQLVAAIGGMRRRLAALVNSRADLLVGIAHDLGTPLTRLAFRVEALRGAAREAAHADILEMQKLIAAALEFARGRDRGVEQVALDMLLVDRVGVLDRTDAPLRVGVAEPLVVTANLLDLARAIDNLLVNAQRHGGGAEISLKRAGHTAELEIRDHGPGIDPAIGAQLFEPLHRGPDPAEAPRPVIGYGLGLAIVQSNVEALGGTVAAANHPSGGALFTVRLPLMI